MLSAISNELNVCINFFLALSQDGRELAISDLTTPGIEPKRICNATFAISYSSVIDNLTPKDAENIFTALKSYQQENQQNNLQENIKNILLEIIKKKYDSNEKITVYFDWEIDGKIQGYSNLPSINSVSAGSIFSPDLSAQTSDPASVPMLELTSQDGPSILSTPTTMETELDAFSAGIPLSQRKNALELFNHCQTLFAQINNITISPTILTRLEVPIVREHCLAEYLLIAESLKDSDPTTLATAQVIQKKLSEDLYLSLLDSEIAMDKWSFYISFSMRLSAIENLSINKAINNQDQEKLELFFWCTYTDLLNVLAPLIPLSYAIMPDTAKHELIAPVISINNTFVEPIASLYSKLKQSLCQSYSKIESLINYLKRAIIFLPNYAPLVNYFDNLSRSFTNFQATTLTKNLVSTNRFFSAQSAKTSPSSSLEPKITRRNSLPTCVVSHKKKRRLLTLEVEKPKAVSDHTPSLYATHDDSAHTLLTEPVTTNEALIFFVYLKFLLAYLNTSYQSSHAFLNTFYLGHEQTDVIDRLENYATKPQDLPLLSNKEDRAILKTLSMLEILIIGVLENKITEASFQAIQPICKAIVLALKEHAISIPFIHAIQHQKVPTPFEQESLFWNAVINLLETIQENIIDRSLFQLTKEELPTELLAKKANMMVWYGKLNAIFYHPDEPITHDIISGFSRTHFDIADSEMLFDSINKLQQQLNNLFEQSHPAFQLVFSSLSQAENLAQLLEHKKVLPELAQTAICEASTKLPEQEGYLGDIELLLMALYDLQRTALNNTAVARPNTPR